MAIADYFLYADLGRDATYSHPLADLSAYVEQVDYTFGMADSFDEIAPPSEFTAVLRDPAFDIMPERPLARYFGLLKPGLAVRFQSRFQNEAQTQYTGRLRDFVPTPGEYGTRQARLVVTDVMRELQKAEYAPTMQEGVRTDEALQAVFDDDVVAFPYTALPDTITAFETGRTTFEYIGDVHENKKQEGVSPWGYIQDVVGAEVGGRFFWNPKTARFVFLSRRHDTETLVSDTFTGDDFNDADADYRYADHLINAITVNFIPRDLGAAGTVVATYPSLPLTVSNLANFRITMRYRTTVTAVGQIGIVAGSGIQPVAGVDYAATDETSGYGATQDRTDRLTVTASFKGDKVVLHIVSTENSTIYLNTLQVRATPAYTFDRIQVSAENAASIAAYERHEAEPLQLLALDNRDFAQQVADSIVKKSGEPIGRFASVSFAGNASDRMMAHALTRAIGDKITIVHAAIGHDSDYIIVGQRHRIAFGGERPHRVTWTLFPAARTRYWRIGVPGWGELGTTNRLIL